MAFPRSRTPSRTPRSAFLRPQQVVCGTHLSSGSQRGLWAYGDLHIQKFFFLISHNSLLEPESFGKPSFTKIAASERARHIISLLVVCNQWLIDTITHSEGERPLLVLQSMTINHINSFLPQIKHCPCPTRNAWQTPTDKQKRKTRFWQYSVLCRLLPGDDMYCTEHVRIFCFLTHYSPRRSCFVQRDHYLCMCV